MCFPIGTSGQVLVLRRPVLARFARYRQHHWWQTEAGGQLFARLSGNLIDVVEASGPRATDRRSRRRYEPDKIVEQKEIDAQHARGLHFIGDWHSHAQRLPSPSGLDLVSIAETVRRSRHHLNGLVLIIVGSSPAPEGLHISVHDGDDYVRLQPSNDVVIDGRPRRRSPVRFV